MCFNNEVIERIFMEDFTMTTRVDIDEYASLLHRSSYYLPLPNEDRQNKRSIKLWAVGFALLFLWNVGGPCVYMIRCVNCFKDNSTVYFCEKGAVFFIFRRTGDNMAFYTLCFHNHHHLGTAESSRFSWIQSHPTSAEISSLLLDSDDSFVCILDQIHQARYICQIHQFLDDIDGFGFLLYS